MLNPPGTPTQQLLGGIEYHRDVGRSRKELCSRPRGASLSKCHQAFYVTTQFLKNQMPLNCRMSGTVYCSRLQEVPWLEHTVLPCMGSPCTLALRPAGSWGVELPGSKWTDCRGLRNTTVSSRSAEAPARVNNFLYTPKVAFACPEEVHK